MTTKHFLFFLPVQALMLLASSAQAHDISTTRFLPDGYTGMACRALAPECMTKQRWASYCEKNIPPSKWPASCRDASHNHRPRKSVFQVGKNLPVPKPLLNLTHEPPTRFLPENHTGPTCMALSPSCMTRSQWAKVCLSKKPITLGHRFANPKSKSCRDALGVRPALPVVRPVYNHRVYANPYTRTPKHLMPRYPSPEQVRSIMDMENNKPFGHRGRAF